MLEETMPLQRQTERESVCNTAYRALSYEYAVGWWVVGFNNTSEVRKSYSRI